MLYLDSHSVTHLLNDALSLKLSEIAFKLHATGQVDQPLRTIVRGAEQQLMGVMPAYIKSGPYQGFGLKSVVVKLGEAAKGPSHSGSVLIYDEPGASPVVAVDAGAITQIRTASRGGPSMIHSARRRAAVCCPSARPARAGPGADGVRSA